MLRSDIVCQGFYPADAAITSHTGASAMGLRHRSIRLRVGILIVVPVLCLIGLYGFAASITLGSALTQAHAKTLRNDLLTPVGSFQQQLATERHLAVLSLANPNSTQWASELGVQENRTRIVLDALTKAVQAPQVTGNASAGERRSINNLLSEAGMLTAIRSNVAANAVSISAVIGDYNAIVNAGYIVLDQALDSLSSVPLVAQALEVINLDRALQYSLAESDLLAGDMSQLRFPTADRITFAELATGRQNLINTATPQLLPEYQDLLTRNVTPTMEASLATLESNVITTPWRKGNPPAELASGIPVFGNYAKAMDTALGQAGAKLQDQTSHDANVVFLELILAAGLGLLGIVASIVLSLVMGRGLVRQLRELRESALALAHEKLPSVISQLRSGEQVDTSEYVPAEASSSNEIEQVQYAFDVVQQTAVQSAIDEARLRRGISDVFRNLAGRSQSLLHRQLTLLDGMERRATEPDELEDLFRIDHLTTRMRRHAEGLIILSGEAPARGWRQPVPLVDVLRAAVAEVEDYTRIRVLARTGAAVAGHAVADVIHLIAELAENATVFSPPNTPVRIQGDVVGRGFAVEIEDRGLGISQARMDEINANLANPPQFDLSGSDRLGLFIAGQLAQRHDIKITLRPSVYGGTTAIVLIPTSLVVDEGTYERDPVLPAGRDENNGLPDRIGGRHAALTQAGGRPGDANGNGSSNGRPGVELEPDFGRAGLSFSGHAAVEDDSAIVGQPESARLTWSDETVTRSQPEPVKLTWSDETVTPSQPEPVKLTWSDDTVAPSQREPVRLSWSDDTVTRSQPEPVRLSWSDDPLATGQPERDTPPVPDPSERGGRVTASEVSELGLPIRVRQASLAPQLRDSSPAAPSAGSAFSSSAGNGHVPPPGPSATGFFTPRPVPHTSPVQTSAPSPEAARNTVSALQRGWQRGRSEAGQDSAEPPGSGYPPATPSTPSTTTTGSVFSPYAARTGATEPDPAESPEQRDDE